MTERKRPTKTTDTRKASEREAAAARQRARERAGEEAFLPRKAGRRSGG